MVLFIIHLWCCLRVDDQLVGQWECRSSRRFNVCVLYYRKSLHKVFYRGHFLPMPTKMLGNAWLLRLGGGGTFVVRFSCAWRLLMLNAWYVYFNGLCLKVTSWWIQWLCSRIAWATVMGVGKPGSTIGTSLAFAEKNLTGMLGWADWRASLYLLADRPSPGSTSQMVKVTLIF